eukprot:Clim_evm51s33 gene=Clim_evmTU51s33
MTITKEYTIPLPLSVEEYQIGQLYAVAEMSKQETGGGDGVEVTKNEPFENEEYGKGQYTYKTYHLETKVPGWIKMVAPKGSLKLREEAWNAYPYCRTVLTNDYMKDNMHIIVETWHKEGRVGDHKNPHDVPEPEYEKMEKPIVDIVNGTLPKNDYDEKFDPKLHGSERAERGPWTEKDWDKKCEPSMVAYKKISVKFKWWGLQTRVEQFIHSTQARLLLKFHRQVVGFLDGYFGWTMEQLREHEDKVAKELEEARNKGPIRGTLAEEE